MTIASRCALIGIVIVASAACEDVSFESLGSLPISAGAASAHSADAGLRDAAPPQLPVDAMLVTAPPSSAAAGMPARDTGAPVSSQGAAGMNAAAGSGGAIVAPADLRGNLDSTPFSVRAGYVAGISDEPQDTNLYLFDTAVSCAQVSTFAWLSQLPAATRIIEITIPSTVQNAGPVRNASVSYMHGGTYAFPKTRPSTSMLILSHVTQAGPIDGTLTASFGSDMIEGAFHAEYCATGTGL